MVWMEAASQLQDRTCQAAPENAPTKGTGLGSIPPPIQLSDHVAQQREGSKVLDQPQDRYDTGSVGQLDQFP